MRRLCIAGRARRLRFTCVRSWLLPVGLFAIVFTSPLSPTSSADAAFGFRQLQSAFIAEDGAPATQAGSHPFSWTTKIAFNTTGADLEEIPEGALKELRIELPTGLVGTPALLPRCSRADFRSTTGEDIQTLPSCPADSAVGVIVLEVRRGFFEALPFPVFNLMPLPGAAAELGFNADGVEATIRIEIDQGASAGLIASLRNISQSVPFFGSTLTLWGDPADPAHDGERAACALFEGPVSCPAGPSARPFLTLARACPAPASVPTIIAADSWQAPDDWISQGAESAALSGCGKLGFSAVIAAQPTTASAGAPGGLNLSYDAPGLGLTATGGIAPADLAKAVLTLPAGMTINPALAAGLAACTRAELVRETLVSAPGQGCPGAAKIGTAEVETPLLTEAVRGTIFVASPDEPASVEPGAENPFDSFFVLYIVLKDPERGVLIKRAIAVDPDPASGRLRTTAEGLPQLPFTHLELHFNAGPRAPLRMPDCGAHAIAYRLTSSSGAPPLSGEAGFSTDQSCASPGFAPTLSAGTTSNAAGRSSPFVVELSSAPAEPNPAALDLTLPPGLGAAFASVTTCPESAAATAVCPSDSHLGHARIALGPGPEPLWIPEPGRAPSAVYLAGPYKAAPYSLLIKVPAQAGPFDLGTVVLRAAIEIDRTSARATVVLDGLPQILAGVPLGYRTIRLVLDRPGFVRNPTSCEPTRVVATVTSAPGASAQLSDRFQAADCAALGLKPKLSLGLSGGLGRNAHPTVTVDVDPRPGDANLRAASLALPYGLFIDPDRMRSSCTRRRFAAHDCPPGTRLGWAEVRTPLLPEPERGRLFLLESDSRLPDLAASLGGRVELDLHGHLEALHTRIRASFDSLPDLPLSRMHVVLKGGFRGLLVNSYALCRQHPPLAAASFIGHNQKQRRLRMSAKVQCPS